MIGASLVIETNGADVEPTQQDTAGAHDAWVESGDDGQFLGIGQVEFFSVGPVPIHEMHFSVTGGIPDPTLTLPYPVYHLVAA